MNTPPLQAEIMPGFTEPDTHVLQYPKVVENGPFSRRARVNSVAEAAVEELVSTVENEVIDGLWVTEETLAITNFSRVLRARSVDEADERDYVIKIPGAGKAPAIRPSIPHELLVLSGLTHHAHIPTVVSWGTIPTEENPAGHAYMIFEEAKEGTVADLLPIKDEQLAHHALELVADGTEAIVDAHKVGIVHRDFKPDNIFDTGEKGILGDWQSAVSEGSKTAGYDVTLGYSPPEDKLGTAPASPASDIYAIGKTLEAVMAHQPSNPAITKLAEQCSDDYPENRPTASEVLRALTGLVLADVAYA
jgi:serine/threonine protein kinase